MLCDLYRVEEGLLMWPDMKDRLTLSVYWKKLKINNSRSHGICIHTNITHPCSTYACSYIVFVSKINTLYGSNCRHLYNFKFISSCRTSNRWVRSCLPTNTLHSSSIVYVCHCRKYTNCYSGVIVIVRILYIQPIYQVKV